MKEIARLLPFVRPYRLKTYLSLVLLIIVVVLDLAIPRLVQHIIDHGILASNLEAVWHTFLWMLAISVTNTLFAVGNNAYSVQVAESVARDLRAALFLKVQSLSFGNLDRLQTGQLMVRLSSDSASIQRVVQIFLRIGTRAPLLMIGSIVLMFTTDRELALLMVPLLLATFGLIILFVTKMRPLFMTMQRKLDRLNTILQENIAGARVVKAFVRADHETRRFESSNEDFTERNIRVIEGLATIGPALFACINIGLVVVIWAGGWQAVRGDVTTGQLVAFINYLQTALVPLLVTAMLANVWAAGSASAERLNEVLDADPDVRDAPDARDLPNPGVPRITFEQVGFRYDLSTDSTVLEDVTLSVEPGQTVALLGATGAGKSTLVHLIPRFYDATEGRVLFDGTDVRQLQQDALRARIGVVPQETVLFSGTIRDTIGYGSPHASDEDIVAAARAAQAHDFILALPHGYDTRVEARGVNLSGGQKQRLAIARALLTRPDILILDDSTSAVDVETETKIQAAIQTWMRGGTCFVVAQRISTVLTADKIVVLDRGRVAAQGTHRRLLKSSPIYREIYMSQLGDGPIEAE